MKLLQGDCLELLKDIPDGSVDMVLTDPPYGMTACAWDKRIDFDSMWDQLRRVLKPTCSTLLFASGLYEPRVMLSNIDHYKYKWVWVKNKPGCFVHAKNRPMTAHECILVFSDAPMGHASVLGDKRMRYNPTGVKTINRSVKARKSQFGPVVGGARPSHKREFVQTATGYPTDVLMFDVPSVKTRVHPTQKPVGLLEFLIETYTDPGQTVLDFTMGSGSTGVACVNSGRDFIGIELDEGYYKTACDRIAEAERAISSNRTARCAR